MSTYSNDPQQNMWEMWFITSVILLLSAGFWETIGNVQDLPVYYDALALATLINLIYCIYIGVKK